MPVPSAAPAIAATTRGPAPRCRRRPWRRWPPAAPRIPWPTRTREPTTRRRSAWSCQHPLDGRGGGALGDLEAHGNALGQLPHVGDDADGAAAGAEVLDGAGHDVERVGVERAEPLVEEQR